MAKGAGRTRVRLPPTDRSLISGTTVTYFLSSVDCRPQRIDEHQVCSRTHAHTHTIPYRLTETARPALPAAMSFHPYTFSDDYRGLDDGYGYGDAQDQSYIGGDYYGDYGHEARDSYSAGDDLLLGDVVADDRLYDHDGRTCPDLYACTDFIEYTTPVYDAWGDESWEEEQVGAEKRTLLHSGPSRN